MLAKLRRTDAGVSRVAFRRERPVAASGIRFSQISRNSQAMGAMPAIALIALALQEHVKRRDVHNCVSSVLHEIASGSPTSYD